MTGSMELLDEFIWLQGTLLQPKARTEGEGGMSELSPVSKSPQSLSLPMLVIWPLLAVVLFSGIETRQR